jgi:hypothetical protein
MSVPPTSPQRPLWAGALQRLVGRSVPRWSRMTSADLVPRLLRSLGLTLLAAGLAAPLALAWGIGHASVQDYLGPHAVEFASSYDSEVEIDLGPLGHAYLPSPSAPVGLEVTVGGVGGSAGTGFFSEETLTAYTSLFADPEEAVAGIVDRLVADMVAESMRAEVVLMLAFAVWVLRRQLLSPAVVRHTSLRRTVVVYATVVLLTVGSILAPVHRQHPVRIPVAVADGTQFEGLSVDSFVLSDLLDRGIKGIAVLSDRQQQAVQRYIDSAAEQMLLQFSELPRAAEGETMYLGFSDLHCNQATTELIKRLAAITEPAQILDSGDDTVNGTAAERGCINREARIAGDAPFLVSTGNHDSDVTETQMKNAGMVVLDGDVVDSDGLAVVGDDDPERQVPFSIERRTDRPETNEQLGQRMVDTAAAKKTDVILVHQPAASVVIMNTPNIPARLVLWGHFHSQQGPTVVRHDDGSWTVGMQQGTAGGVKQPMITSFSTPFSPPLTSADVYFYFRDNATGLFTGVQPVHFLPNADVVVDERIQTGDLAALPSETRVELSGASPTATPTPR